MILSCITFKEVTYLYGCVHAWCLTENKKKLKKIGKTPATD